MCLAISVWPKMIYAAIHKNTKKWLRLYFGVYLNSTYSIGASPCTQNKIRHFDISLSIVLKTRVLNVFLSGFSDWVTIPVKLSFFPFSLFLISPSSADVEATLKFKPIKLSTKKEVSSRDVVAYTAFFGG